MLFRDIFLQLHHKFFSALSFYYWYCMANVRGSYASSMPGEKAFMQQHSCQPWAVRRIALFERCLKQVFVLPQPDVRFCLIASQSILGGDDGDSLRAQSTATAIGRSCGSADPMAANAVLINGRNMPSPAAPPFRHWCTRVESLADRKEPGELQIPWL